MSRIYEALKRVERNTPAEEPASPAPAATGHTLEEYPREASVVAERQARAASAKAQETSTPWSSSAERIETGKSSPRWP